MFVGLLQIARRGGKISRLPFRLVLSRLHFRAASDDLAGGVPPFGTVGKQRLFPKAMVKTKHQKSKPKKAPKVKQQGKQADLTMFRGQLDGLGLKIIQVTADGNCFFSGLLLVVYRSLADQLDGNEEEHGKYRSMIVQYIRENRELFEPFLEDDVPFDEYCQQMEKDGTWAGHMELQAASLVTNSNICIHRNMSPRWYIQNFDQRGARMIHLSYHDEEHYNSLRSKEDLCDGPARPIVIKADATLSQVKAASSKSNGLVLGNKADSGSVKVVMAGSGCENIEKVEQVLLQVHGDVDAAIEYLIAERESENYSVDNGSLPCQAHSFSENLGDNVDGRCDQSQDEISKKTRKHELSDSPVKESTKDTSSKTDDKKIPRNKVCPCGSKKKYKSCCGVAKGRSSSMIMRNQAIETGCGRVRKDKKQNKKGGHAESLPSCGSENVPLDMGALCI
ncbi:unnamed protein product [Linum tenue]|uniref:OTU domain-containing protein n=1 Tax=Linum tenue TaxID=586396 RepID=A0AAV0J8H3_9ROSI|nr:unnamed protein product [Linum tenue]